MRNVLLFFTLTEDRKKKICDWCQGMDLKMAPETFREKAAGYPELSCRFFPDEYSGSTYFGTCSDKYSHLDDNQEAKDYFQRLAETLRRECKTLFDIDLEDREIFHTQVLAPSRCDAGCYLSH